MALIIKLGALDASTQDAVSLGLLIEKALGTLHIIVVFDLKQSGLLFIRGLYLELLLNLLGLD